MESCRNLRGILLGSSRNPRRCCEDSLTAVHLEASGIHHSAPPTITQEIINGSFRNPERLLKEAMKGSRKKECLRITLEASAWNPFGYLKGIIRVPGEAFRILCELFAESLSVSGAIPTDSRWITQGALGNFEGITEPWQTSLGILIGPVRSLESSRGLIEALRHKLFKHSFSWRFCDMAFTNLL